MTWHEELWLGKEREIEKKDKEEVRYRRDRDVGGVVGVGLTVATSGRQSGCCWRWG